MDIHEIVGGFKADEPQTQYHIMFRWSTYCSDECGSYYADAFVRSLSLSNSQKHASHTQSRPSRPSRPQDVVTQPDLRSMVQEFMHFYPNRVPKGFTIHKLKRQAYLMFY
jgi:hypothetical protein